jgi:hypothetical protein
MVGSTTIPMERRRHLRGTEQVDTIPGSEAEPGIFHFTAAFTGTLMPDKIRHTPSREMAEQWICADEEVEARLER